VFVVPSLVIIDENGRVVRALAGANPRGSDGLLEDMLVGAGRSAPGAVEPDSPKGQDESAQRVARLTRMGEQLQRRGLLDAAEQSFRQALAIAPDDVGANLDLGELLNRAGRWEEGAACFEAALAQAPDSERAHVGLITSRLNTEGADLSALEHELNGLVAMHPDDARVHFLLGSIQERRADFEAAARSYKRAASLLLNAMESEPGEK
jgi:tetratricopeptide (TPR) repeat protein